MGILRFDRPRKGELSTRSSPQVELIVPIRSLWYPYPKLRTKGKPQRIQRTKNPMHTSEQSFGY
jgi:hypothetical protein